MGVLAEQARIVAGHDHGGPGGPDGPGVGVSVPATSANLGPGYDSFGVALDVPLIAVAVPRREQRILPRGLGAQELPTGDDNLVWRALRAWCAHAGTTPPDVSVQVDSAIPLERGMGSSSAAAVAGLLLGRALTGGSATTDRLLAMATDLEGHPDNAAAALAGGLVACDDRGGFIRVTPTGALRPVLLVPAQRQSTKAARAALPTEVPLAVAAANTARATATFTGLAGLTALRAQDMVDALHEPARLRLMPVSWAMVDALRHAGMPCALSGAGPSVLAVLPSGDPAALDRLQRVVADVVAADEVEVVPTAWDLRGAVVCPPG